MKQSNYITLFLAPIAILAGVVVTNIPRSLSWLLITVVLFGGGMLSALEQQSYQVFTANSRGLLTFAEQHPDHQIIGTLNNDRIACFYQVLAELTNCDNSRVHAFSENVEKFSNTSDMVFTVIDRENINWGAHSIKIDTPPKCWTEIGTVIPASTGYSHYLLHFIIQVSKFLPANLTNKIQSMQTPKPATIYTANISNLWCTHNMPGEIESTQNEKAAE